MEVELPAALAARDALRRDAGMAEERFPLPALIGMLSDEIEASRKVGRSDQAIADLLGKAAGIEISAMDVARYYAEPEERERR